MVWRMLVFLLRQVFFFLFLRHPSVHDHDIPWLAGSQMLKSGVGAVPCADAVFNIRSNPSFHGSSNVSLHEKP